MTSYGTIPASARLTEPTNHDYISRTKDRLKSGLADRRPWIEMFELRSLKVPSSLSHALSRAITNITYFRTNYATVFLLVLFLSLLWHPISLIVFVVIMAAWLSLYFLRDEPVDFFGKAVDDRLVLIVMSVMTVVFLLLTHVTVNVLAALIVGAVIVVTHAVLRKTDNLLIDEESVGTRGLITRIDGGGSPPSA